MPGRAGLRVEAGRLKRRRCVAIALAVATLSGCAAHTRGAADLTSSNTSSGGAIGIDIQGGSGWVALFGLGVLAAGIHGAPSVSREPPPLLDGRRISVQDCTRPLEDASGNLSCR